MTTPAPLALRHRQVRNGPEPCVRRTTCSGTSMAPGSRIRRSRPNTRAPASASCCSRRRRRTCTRSWSRPRPPEMRRHRRCGRLGDMYTSFMDEKRVDERGVAPLAPLFAEIAAIDGPQTLARFFGRAQGLGIDVPLGIYVYPDARNSTHNIAYLTQAGLGPAESRLLTCRTRRPTSNSAASMSTTSRKLITLAGEPDGAARAGEDSRARDAIARVQWTPVREPRPDQDLQPARPRIGGARWRRSFDWRALHRGGWPAGRGLRHPPAELRRPRSASSCMAPTSRSGRTT